MSDTYYQQHPWGHQPKTLTVAALRAALAELDGDLPVIFRSPKYGAFGSNTSYSVDTVARETLAASTIHNRARAYVDDETGEDVQQDAYDEHLPAWDGVVIA